MNKTERIEKLAEWLQKLGDNWDDYREKGTTPITYEQAASDLISFEESTPRSLEDVTRVVGGEG